MSELTPCNFCMLQRIKRDAEKNSQQVVLRKEQVVISVYVFPFNVKMPKGEIYEDDEFHKQYWVCAFLALTEHCCC